MLGDTAVRAVSQIATYREQLVVVVGAKIGTPWYVHEHPRQFLWANQTDPGAPASLTVEWAVRDSAAPGVPEWLFLQTIILVPGGATPVLTPLVTGAVWLRFTLNGGAGQTAELAASAFV